MVEQAANYQQQRAVELGYELGTGKNYEGADIEAFIGESEKLRKERLEALLVDKRGRSLNPDAFDPESVSRQWEEAIALGLVETPEMLFYLCEDIARFHEQSESGPHIKRWTIGDHHQVTIATSGEVILLVANLALSAEEMVGIVRKPLQGLDLYAIGIPIIPYKPSYFSYFFGSDDAGKDSEINNFVSLNLSTAQLNTCAKRLWTAHQGTPRV